MNLTHYVSLQSESPNRPISDKNAQSWPLWEEYAVCAIDSIIEKLECLRIKENIHSLVTKKENKAKICQEIYIQL